MLAAGRGEWVTFFEGVFFVELLAFADIAIFLVASRCADRRSEATRLEAQV
jgi:hypothetical protein